MLLTVGRNRHHAIDVDAAVAAVPKVIVVVRRAVLSVAVNCYAVLSSSVPVSFLELDTHT